MAQPLVSLNTTAGLRLTQASAPRWGNKMADLRLLSVFGVFVACVISAGSVLAASQGQLGATSKGSVEIGLIKTETVRIASASIVPAPAAASANNPAGNNLAVCVSADGVEAFDIGLLDAAYVQSLSPLNIKSGKAGCTGTVRQFAMPQGVSNPRVLTLLASPL